MRNIFQTFIITAALLFVAGAAQAYVIDFEGYDHGEIINSQYQSLYGVTITADNPNRDFNLATIFDTTINASQTSDDDLLAPFTGGNLAGQHLGNALILSENREDSTNPGFVADPDDEGQRPAGYFEFAFDEAIRAFGFDLIDIEQRELSNGYFISLYSGSDDFQIGFGDLLTPALFGGDNTANRIAPIVAADYGVDAFDLVRIHLGGSGAIDNINVVTTPEPSTFLLLGLGLLAVIGIGRKRYSRS